MVAEARAERGFDDRIAAAAFDIERVRQELADADVSGEEIVEHVLRLVAHAERGVERGAAGVGIAGERLAAADLVPVEHGLHDEIAVGGESGSS